MRKTQFVLEDPPKSKQTGFAPRRRNDLEAERQFALSARYRHGQDGEADQRDDEGHREIVDRRLQDRTVDRRDVADLVRPRDHGSSGRDQEIGTREQVAKAAIDDRAAALGIEIVLRGEIGPGLDVPDHGRRQLVAARLEQIAIAVGDVSRTKRPERLDRTAAIRRVGRDVRDARQGVAGPGEAPTDVARNRRDAEIGCRRARWR